MKSINKKIILAKMTLEKDKIKSKGVRKLGLFGSFAKGKQHKKSDIDIIVTFDYPNFDKYAELLILLEKMFKRKIDLVIESNLRKELDYIKNEAEYVKL